MFANNGQVESRGLPLEIICNPARETAREAGEALTLSVVVSNRGDFSVLLVLSVDESAGATGRWCASPRTFLTLAPGQSDEIFFRFDIPFDTLPGVYPYTVKIDSSEHYRDALPLFQRGRLRVLPPVRETKRASDPTFALSPPTRPDEPFPLPPGATVLFVALVENRSERVDRFEIVCPDAPADWVRVNYPDAAGTTGITRGATAIELNPGQAGQVQLAISPPLTARAGVYPLSVRLYSVDDPALVLLELLHLQVLEIHQLDIELLPLLDKVKRGPARFQLRASNRGNAPRTVAISIGDADETRQCRYHLEKQELTLPPGTQEIIELTAVPPPAWQRSFSGRAFSFWSDIADRQELPLPVSRLQGTWFWQPRPWWQFLLCLLLLFGAIGTAVLLILWWLQRPAIAPRIDTLVPASSTYLELDDEPVRLSWQITNPRQLGSLELQGLSPDGALLSGPTTYDFTTGIPPALRDVCEIARVLTCVEVPTAARKAGDYRFQLTAVPREKSRAAPVSLTTNRVRIEPIPQPRATEFATSEPTYLTSDRDGIRLDWEIENFSAVRALRLEPTRTDLADTGEGLPQIYEFDRPATIPATLAPFCTASQDRLSCRRVPTGTSAPGTYVYDLTLIPQNPGKIAVEMARTEPVAVVSPLQIETFAVDGEPALPVYRLNLLEKTFLSLAWSVQGDSGLMVELLPAPGGVEPVGTLVYPIGPEPQREVISLQATDRSGSRQTRSIVVETFLPDPVSPATPPKETMPPETSPDIDPPPTIPDRPSTPVEAIEDIPPSELPPRF